MTEHDHEDDRLFASRSRALFDESVAGLDAATRSALRQARDRALDEMESERLLPAWFRARPSALAAGLLVAVVSGWLLLVRDGVAPPMAPALAEPDDLELLLLEDELEMLEELEFYAWLDEQPEIQAIDTAGDGRG